MAETVGRERWAIGRNPVRSSEADRLKKLAELEHQLFMNYALKRCTFIDKGYYISEFVLHNATILLPEKAQECLNYSDNKNSFWVPMLNQILEFDSHTFEQLRSTRYSPLKVSQKPE